MRGVGGVEETMNSKVQITYKYKVQVVTHTHWWADVHKQFFSKRRYLFRPKYGGREYGAIGYLQVHFCFFSIIQSYYIG